MDLSRLLEEVTARLGTHGPVALDPRAALVVGAAALLVLGPLWGWARVAVTLVHELGHALVGILVGRRFTDLVLRADMSGHAVTVGRARGPGLVLTLWAGYPMPALVGAGLVALALRGYAAPLLAVSLLVLLLAAPRLRSAYTFVVLALALGAVGLVWWRGSASVQALVVLALGVVLLVGAWRHLAIVVTRGGADDDPARLRAATRVPRAVWHLSYLLVLGAASAAAAFEVATALRR